MPSTHGGQDTRARDDLFERARGIIARIDSELAITAAWAEPGPAASSTHSLSPARGRPPQRPLDASVDAAVDLAITIGLIVDRYLPTSPDHGRVQQTLVRSRRRALGSLFSQAITQTLSGSAPHNPTARCEAFSSAAQVSRVRLSSADPATLEKTLLESLRKLAACLCELPPGPSKAPEWSVKAGQAHSVLNKHLRRNALPMFTRGERPDPQKASISRIAALILAAEADRMERMDIGDMFRQVAAGVTLLESRVTGERQVTEVIMLALA